MVQCNRLAANSTELSVHVLHDVSGASCDTRGHLIIKEERQGHQGHRVNRHQIEELSYCHATKT